MSGTRPLVLIPGLGADARLLAPQLAAFPDLLVPPWLDPKKRESLPAYAARLATTLPITKDTVLGGVSFGGMLALEIARTTPVRGVILIASCRHPRAIAPSVRRFAKLGLMLPIPDSAKRLAPMALAVLGPMKTPANRKLLSDMAETTSLPFMKWAARAIFDWKGCESLPCPVLIIHGSRDRVILAAAVQADLSIRGAGHVVNLTHASEVNEAIRTFIA